MKTVRSFLFAIAWLLVMVAIVDACPTCKESVAENGGNLIRGYFWSIIFMMSMPFLILTGLSVMFYLDVRRARKRQELSHGLPVDLPNPTRESLSVSAS